MSIVKRKILVLFGAVLMLAGCAMPWRAQTDLAHDNRPNEKSEALLLAADTCFSRAGDGGSLARCEQIYQDILAVNPGDYRALTQLSTINILFGTAYTNAQGEKSERFRKAMSYAEQAMYTNLEFRARVAAGETIWAASDSLTRKEIEAMFFWVTALQYEFKEGMNLPEKIINVKWLRRALLVLERVEEVDPEFGGGGVEFAKAICYYALPSIYGGSDELGDREMQDAIEHSDGWILPRWARGKYYYVITGQPEKSREELQWVASRNPLEFNDPYPWRMHFIQNSSELLR